MNSILWYKAYICRLGLSESSGWEVHYVENVDFRKAMRKGPKVMTSVKMGPKVLIMTVTSACDFNIQITLQSGIHI